MGFIFICWLSVLHIVIRVGYNLMQHLLVNKAI